MKTHKIQNSQNPIDTRSPFRKGAPLAGLLFLGLAVSGLAADRDNLDQRIRNLADRFEAMQAKPGKRISPEVLRKAQGTPFDGKSKPTAAGKELAQRISESSIGKLAGDGARIAN